MQVWDDRESEGLAVIVRIGVQTLPRPEKVLTSVRVLNDKNSKAVGNEIFR